MRRHVEDICSRFVASGLSDPDFESELCSGAEPRFWQRFTEASLTCDVLDAGISVLAKKSGPDLCIEHEGRRIWVEIVSPEPTGIPTEWLVHEPGQCYTFPHVPMLLRWTAAIKEKTEKLLGAESKVGYLQRGVVTPDDCYVIAVNARQLRGVFASLTGISQFPFAVEAAFAVGPYQVHFDRQTLAAVKAEHQQRPYIQKPSGARVPAYTFLDGRFAVISAIWATDFDDCSVLGHQKASAVVHNPLASNPLAERLLPAQSEYVATELEDGGFELARRAGRLS